MRKPKPWAWREIIHPEVEVSADRLGKNWRGLELDVLTLLKGIERRIERLTTLKKRRGKA